MQEKPMTDKCAGHDNARPDFLDESARDDNAGCNISRRKCRA